MYGAGVGQHQGFVQPQFKITAVGIGTIDSTLDGPVLEYLILGNFLAKISLCEYFGRLRGTFDAQELAIEIDLADVI